MTRYAHKIDANQGEIAEALTRAGYHVTDTSGYGGGFPDLAVTGCDWLLLLEVKVDGGKLTGPELDFFQRHAGSGCVVLVYDAEAALDACYAKDGR
jgi:hypothetical protein